MRRPFALLALLAAAACSGNQPVGARGCPPACSIPTAIPVTFAGGSVASEIASLRAQRETGLMNRPSIAADSGTFGK